MLIRVTEDITVEKSLIQHLFKLYQKYRREYAFDNFEAFDSLVRNNPDNLIGELGFDVAWAVLFADWEGNYQHSHHRNYRPYKREHTPEEWEEKKEQYGQRCFYCGKKKTLCKDHVIPLSRGGLDKIDNIVPACKSCNSKKHTKALSDFKNEAMVRML